MDELIHQLNYDFNIQVYLFNNAIENLSTHDKNIAIAWVNKLKSAAGSVHEARVRNDFLYYLVKSCTTGQLTAPFREKPPKGPLLNLLSLLPDEVGAGKDLKGGGKRAEIFEKSPDKGAFLAAQPVPRCGAFCYLAVISKPP